MAAEFREAPEVVERQAQFLRRPLQELAHTLQRLDPKFVVTCARGSSGKAADFAKYLFERHLGLPVAALAPSIMSVYGRELCLENQLFLALSQSGRSEDLVRSAAGARAAGALTVALVNDTESPLARACECVVPIAAGPELGIPATKSFIASLTALLRLTAFWANNQELGEALERLPPRLAAATTLDWAEAGEALWARENMAVLGRGPTLAIAKEVSLKLKEVCGIHAEAFSGAEFQHGPIALVTKDFPVLVLVPNDLGGDGLRALAADIWRKGGVAFIATPNQSAGHRIPVLVPDHADVDAVALAQSLYGFVLQLAKRRGIDPDQPRHLQKVTHTR
jgi:glutamine---fructose-6-phosphate transaminase (isomerizing)